MSLLELSSVTKAFYADRACTEATIALNDVNLCIEEGEFVCLLGPSGCGKTVTLGLMAGFDTPTSGTVTFKGSPITCPSPERGVVFQEYSLFPWLSVRGNIEYALKAKGLSKEDRQSIALDALERVGMERFLDRRPNLLSGGMKQRVAIARVLAMNSDVMLMDEPFSALDEQSRTALDALIRNLWRTEQKTIVFVTHSISEAIAISSRIVLFTGSPGRVAHEWHLPDSMDREEGSPEVRALSDDIRATMNSYHRGASVDEVLSIP